MKKFFFAVAVVAAFSGAFNAKAADFDDGGDFGDYDYSSSYDDWGSWTYSYDYEECEVMCKI